ncbi:MAG: hypothetical protein RIM80_15975 [Alphaproteobacteria bacterium]
MSQAPPQGRPFVDPRIGAFALFALAVAAATFSALLSPAPDYARAANSIWPCIALGGWAVARALNRCPDAFDGLWRVLWTLGFLAYLIHLWFALGGVFQWSLGAVFDVQGTVVTAANLALAALWGVSVAAAWLGIRATWLHIAAKTLFAATTVVASIPFARDMASLAGGLLVVAVWIGALALRRQRA